MKTLRLFRPGGTVAKRVLVRRLDSAGVQVSAFKATRQEVAYLRAMGRMQ